MCCCRYVIRRRFITGQQNAFGRNDKAPHYCEASLYGAGTRSRTRDLLITSQLLYQLSYTGICGAPL